MTQLMIGQEQPLCQNQLNVTQSFYTVHLCDRQIRKDCYIILYSLFLVCDWLRQHPLNGPLSGTTQVSRYQKGKTNLEFTEARDSEWQWHQLGHMQICTSLQTDNHASTSPLSFLQAGYPSCRPTNSVKALKSHNCKGNGAFMLIYFLYQCLWPSLFNIYNKLTNR